MAHKILIIDDDDFLLDMYSLKFKEGGFDVSLCKNGAEAVSQAQTFKPDIILVDIVMPNIDGFQVIKLLKEKIGGSAKIIAFSNLDQKDGIDKALYCGADDFIKKADFTPSEILKKIKKLLNK
ncbi:MAG: response regulator [Patescibacteria group bacterium]